MGKKELKGVFWLCPVEGKHEPYTYTVKRWKEQVLKSANDARMIVRYYIPRATGIFSVLNNHLDLWEIFLLLACWALYYYSFSLLPSQAPTFQYTSVKDAVTDASFSIRTVDTTPCVCAGTGWWRWCLFLWHITMLSCDESGERGSQLDGWVYQLNTLVCIIFAITNAWIDLLVHSLLRNP